MAGDCSIDGTCEDDAAAGLDDASGAPVVSSNLTLMEESRRALQQISIGKQRGDIQPMLDVSLRRE